MTHRTLDSMLKTYCQQNGDPYLHSWTQVYPIAVVWLEYLAQHGTKDAVYIKIDLPAAVNSTARVIQLPQSIELVDVGTIVRGNFRNMSMNPAMVLSTDECLRLVADGSGHSDPDPLFIPDAPAYVGFPFVPGTGDGRGVNGQWKWWRDTNVLQIDGLSPHTSITIKATMNVFDPYVDTMIDSRLEPVLQAYLAWQEMKADNTVISNLSRVGRESTDRLEMAFKDQMNMYLKVARRVPMHYVFEALRA